jgi:hypothetical protein
MILAVARFVGSKPVGEPAPDKKREREGDLRHHEAASHSGLALPDSCARGALLQHRLRLYSRNCQRRHEAEQETEQEARDHAEEESDAVDAHLDRQGARAVDDGGREQADEPSRRDRSSDRAEQEDDDGLGDHLPREPERGRPQRGARCHLGLARLGAREQQVRHVRADDDEDERHGRE